MLNESSYIDKQIGNYRVVSELDSGSFGRVYQARHVHISDLTVAIKLLRAHLRSQQERDRFLLEARLLSKLKHPHILSFFDFGLVEEEKKIFPYLVTEFAPGGSLRDRIDEQFPKLLSIEESLIILSQVGQALHYAHQQNIVHRDLKPDNILFSANKEALLADFGVATVLDSTSIAHGTIAGTPAYMAPEQFEGVVSKKSDQYALGCIAYELFSGHKPFNVLSGGLGAWWDAHKNEEPIVPTRYNPHLPIHIERAILKSMAKDRNERHPDVSAFIIAMNTLPISQVHIPTNKYHQDSSSNISLQSSQTQLQQTQVPIPNQYEPRNASWAAMSAAALTAGDLDAQTVEDASSTHGGEEDRDALPPTAEGPQAVESSPPADTTTQEPGATNDPQGSAREGIIVFPTPEARARTAGKLPAAAAPVAVPVPPVQFKEPPVLPTKRRNAGKRAAGAGAVMAGAAVGAGAGLASRTASTGGGTPPPPGGGGGDGPRRINRSLLAVLLILVTVLLLAGIAFAAPGDLSHLSNMIPGSSPTATVTITPASKDVKDAFVITAVTGNPDATKRQVPARKLSYTTPPQSKTVPATGQVNTKAIQATGVLTFFNGNQVEYTVSAGTVFTDSHGVKVENIGAVNIPAGNPQTGFGRATASAIAVVGGASGNIKALDFNLVTCCGSNAVSVSNNAAFTGGQDPQHFTAVSQSDIDGAANSLKTAQLQTAQKSFQSQIRGNEQLVNPAQCNTNVTSNHKAGDRASSVTATVTATCTGEVFDQQAARTMAASLLTMEAQKTLDSTYMLLDNKVVTQITSAGIIDARGTVSLNVKAEGIWVYQFSDAAKQNLAKLIAGKSEADAKTLLLQQPGVSDVQISISSGTTLPTNPSDITIDIKTVSGLPGTGTPTAPTPTGTTPATSATPTATPTSEPGLGGS